MITNKFKWYWCLKENFTSWSSSLAALSTLGFTCFFVIWLKSEFKNCRQNMRRWRALMLKTEIFEKKSLHGGLLRAGWSLPRDQQGEASWQLVSLQKNYFQSSFLPPPCHFDLEGIGLFVLFMQNKYELSPTAGEYWKSAAWLPEGCHGSVCSPSNYHYHSTRGEGRGDTLYITLHVQAASTAVGGILASCNHHCLPPPLPKQAEVVAQLCLVISLPLLSCRNKTSDNVNIKKFNKIKTITQGSLLTKRLHQDLYLIQTWLFRVAWW